MQKTTVVHPVGTSWSAVIGGWMGAIGGAVPVEAAREVVVEEHRIERRERPRFRLLPVGRKGGERVPRDEEVRESRIER